MISQGSNASFWRQLAASKLSRGFHPAVWNCFGEMSRSLRRIERAVYGGLDCTYARRAPRRSHRRHYAWARF